MLPESIYKKHIMFNSGDLINNISYDFLKNRGLKHFSYNRQYFNPNKQFTLTTHPQLSEDYLRLQFYNVTKYDKAVAQIDSIALLWIGLPQEDKKLISYVRDYYHLDNGMIITKRYDSFCESFYFAASSDNYKINQDYLANLDEYYNFCFYFKEQAKKIILEADQTAIYIPDMKTDIFLEQEYQYANRNTLINIENPLFKKLYYTADFDKTITKREFQCLNGLAFGKRIKDIAEQLSISERSVRSYLEMLRTKTGLSSHNELIKFYHQLF